MPTCLFCHLLESSGIPNLIASDDRTVSILHEDWAVKGHAVLIWRGHVENLSDLSEEDFGHYARALWRLESALLVTTGRDRAVILKLGIMVTHLHVHIYPVSSHDDRQAVMSMIDAKVRKTPSAGEEEQLIAGLRKALKEGRNRR